MKWFNRLFMTAMLSGMLVLGVYIESVPMIALMLAVPYLFTILLFSRFTKARDYLFNEVILQRDKFQFLNAPVLPLSCDKGVHMFQQKGEARIHELGGYHFSVSELQSNLLEGEGIESYKLEKRYHQFLRESRFYILLAQLMGIGYATYMVYAEREYILISIPVLMFLYHYFFYAHIFEGVSAVKFSQKMNADREFLKDLMEIYVEIVLGVKEATETSVDVFPMGDILVRFVKDEQEHFYYVPYDDRLVMEEFLVIAMEEQAEEEKIETKDE